MLDRNLTRNFHKSDVINPAGAYAPIDESGNVTKQSPMPDAKNGTSGLLTWNA